MSSNHSSIKRKNYNLICYKLGLIVFSIIILISTIFLFTLNLKQSRQKELSLTKPTPIAASIYPSQVSSDLFINLPFWWNSDFAQYSKIAVNNPTNNTIDQDKYATFSFNHLILVQKGMSSADGSDFQMVYKNGKEIQKIDFNIENPNTTSTLISFNTRNGIKSKLIDDNYFLYFNNRNNTSQTKRQITSSSDQLYARIVETINFPFLITSSRQWLLKGSNLSDEYSKQHIVLKIDKNIRDKLLPTITQSFNLAISTTNKQYPLTKNNDGDFETYINSDSLEVGDYIVQANIKLNTYEFKSQRIKFIVSYPLYITWSIDWEGFDVNNKYLDEMTALSAQFKIPMTQFFNPRIYNISVLSLQRKEYLTNWIKDRINIGDELGMHLHMFQDMVAASGVIPKSQPDWGSRSNGYSTLTTAYSAPEFAKMLNWGIEQFKANGLGVPKGYRAGGWFINSELLTVLNDNGFVYDSSGRESYIFGIKPQKGFWNLGSTTKPYRPNTLNQNSSSNPNLKLWEIPNNGLDSTNNTENVMISKYRDNFSGTPLPSSQILTFCTHPHWMNIDIPRLEKLFSTIDSSAASHDNGPIIYKTIYNAYLDYTK